MTFCPLSPVLVTVALSADENKIKQLFVLLGNDCFHHNYFCLIRIARRVPLARRIPTVPFVFERHAAATNHRSLATLAVQSTAARPQSTSIYGPAGTSSLRWRLQNVSLRCEAPGVKAQDTEDVTHLGLRKAFGTGLARGIMGVRIVKRFIFFQLIPVSMSSHDSLYWVMGWRWLRRTITWLASSCDWLCVCPLINVIGTS